MGRFFFVRFFSFFFSNFRRLTEQQGTSRPQRAPPLRVHFISVSQNRKDPLQQTKTTTMPSYYISVTGFTLKSMLYLPKFMAYSIPAARQAAEAEGNLFSEQRYIDGVLHTLTAWKDKQSMRRYMLSGAHAKAMKITQDVGNLEYGTKTYGYESESIPTWTEALKIWEDKGTLHGRPMPSKRSTAVSSSSKSTSIIAAKNLWIPFVVVPSSCLLLAWFLLTRTEILDQNVVTSLTSNPS